MLYAEPLKNHAGIRLVGSYLDLRALHTVLHTVNEGSSIIRDKEGWLLALAYDVRKAYEGEEEIINAPADKREIGTLYGVEMPWPLILTQLKLLRESLGFVPSDKLTQSVVFALEYAVETAVTADFKSDAPAIISAYGQLGASHPEFEKRIESRVGAYLHLTKKERARGLGAILMSMSVMYDLIQPELVKQGIAAISPGAFAQFDGVEWPNY